MSLRLLACLNIGALFAALAATSASAEDFDGPYAGAAGGIAILHAEGDRLAGPFETTDETAYAGGFLGYRTRVLGESGPVLGVEGDVGVTTDEGDMRYGVSAILGMPIGAGSLVYGRAGYGWREGLPADLGKGAVFGGGFETRLSGKLGLRLDYKYLDLGNRSIPDDTVSYTGHEIAAGLVLGF